MGDEEVIVRGKGGVTVESILAALKETKSFFDEVCLFRNVAFELGLSANEKFLRKVGEEQIPQNGLEKAWSKMLYMWADKKKKGATLKVLMNALGGINDCVGKLKDLEREVIGKRRKSKSRRSPLVVATEKDDADVSDDEDDLQILEVDGVHLDLAGEELEEIELIDLEDDSSFPVVAAEIKRESHFYDDDEDDAESLSDKEASSSVPCTPLDIVIALESSEEFRPAFESNFCNLGWELRINHDILMDYWGQLGEDKSKLPLLLECLIGQWAGEGRFNLSEAKLEELVRALKNVGLNEGADVIRKELIDGRQADSRSGGPIKLEEVDLGVVKMESVDDIGVNLSNVLTGQAKRQADVVQSEDGNDGGCKRIRISTGLDPASSTQTSVQPMDRQQTGTEVGEKFCELPSEASRSGPNIEGWAGLLEVECVLKQAWQFFIPNLEENFDKIARRLGVLLMEGGSGKTDKFWECYKTGRIGGERAFGVLLEAWMELRGGRPRLVELIDALDAVGMTLGADVLRKALIPGWEGQAGSPAAILKQETDSEEWACSERASQNDENETMNWQQNTAGEETSTEINVAEENVPIEILAENQMNSELGKENPGGIAVPTRDYNLRSHSAVVGAKNQSQAACPAPEKADDCECDSGNAGDLDLIPDYINERDKLGNTRLHYAARSGVVPVVWKLLQMGAKANVKNNQGETPIYMVAKWNANGKTCGRCYVDIIKLLVEQGGADVYYVSSSSRNKSSHGGTFLHHLLKKREVNNVWKGASHFHKCWIITPSLFHELGKFLVGEGHANLFNTRDSFGVTPLHHAIETVDVSYETLKLLKENGVDFTLANGWGSALSFPVKGHRSTELLSSLIKLGVKYRIEPENDGASLVQLAAHWGNADALVFLVKKMGLDVNTVCSSSEDDLNSSPLHLAVQSKHGSNEQIHKCVKFLVENGGDREARDKSGRTPVQVVPQRRREDLLDLLQTF